MNNDNIYLGSNEGPFCLMALLLVNHVLKREREMGYED